MAPLNCAGERCSGSCFCCFWPSANTWPLPPPLTYPGDEVVLQVEDPQLPAPAADVLDPLDVLLVQRNFLQGEDLALVVLSPAADHLFCDWRGGTESTQGSVLEEDCVSQGTSTPYAGISAADHSQKLLFSLRK